MTLVLYSLFLESLRGILEHHKGSPTGKGTGDENSASRISREFDSRHVSANRSILLAVRDVTLQWVTDTRKGMQWEATRETYGHVYFAEYGVFYNSKALVLNRAQVQFRYFPTAMDDVPLICVSRNP